MAWADHSFAANRLRLIFLLLLPFLIREIDYHVLGDHFTLCPFRLITGRDCYGCGFGRGISAFLHLDFPAMTRLNRMNVVTVPLIAYVYLRELITAFRRDREMVTARRPVSRG